MGQLVRMNVAPDLDVSVLAPDGIPDGRPAGVVDVAAVDISRQLHEAWTTVGATARSAASALRSTLSDVAPDELTVEFGILLGSEAGLIFASAKSEAQLKCTLTWKKQS